MIGKNETLPGIQAVTRDPTFTRVLSHSIIVWYHMGAMPVRSFLTDVALTHSMRVRRIQQSSTAGFDAR